MSWTDIPLYKKTSGAPMVSAYLKANKGGQVMLNVFLSSFIVDKFEGDAFVAQVGAGEHAGCLRIFVDPEGPHKIARAMRVNRLTLPWFEGLPKGKTVSQPCPVLSEGVGEVVIRLPIPEWEIEISRRDGVPKSTGLVPARQPMHAREPQRVLPIEKPVAAVKDVSVPEDAIDAVAYLKKKGIVVVRLGGGRFTIDGIAATHADVISEVDAARRSAGLPAVGAGGVW